MDHYARWVQRKEKSCTDGQMKAHLKHCKPLADYKKGGKVHVHDRMCKRPFSYTLAAAPGEGYRIPGKFTPKYTPAQMLAKGIFGGKYLNDCMDEFPREWFEAALEAGKLSPSGRDFRLNMRSRRRSLTVAQEAIYGGERGGSVVLPLLSGPARPEVDAIQMAGGGSSGATSTCCAAGRRGRPRQALLQWAHDDRVNPP